MWDHPIMKICEKLCDKIETRNSVSASDVVQACLATCLSSELGMLQRRPPDACDSVGSLALRLSQHLLLCVGEALCQRRPPKALWLVCSVCWTMCTAWLLPTNRKWNGGQDRELVVRVEAGEQDEKRRKKSKKDKKSHRSSSGDSSDSSSSSSDEKKKKRCSKKDKKTSKSTVLTNSDLEELKAFKRQAEIEKDPYRG